MIRLAKATAVLLGLAVLAWQGVNAAQGRGLHPFLIADLVVGVFLIGAAFWPGHRGSSLAMLAGFSALAGVFLSATTSRLLLGGYDLGTALTSLGLIPCIVYAVGLGIVLARPG
ncbi:MAG: hypothetical protein ABI353_15185 [Isosphaeraceae bacterium]